MGGSSNSSSQPYDQLGGQYASFSGGTPGYNYAPLGQAIGQGFTSFGRAVAQGSQQPTPQFGGTNFQQFTIPSQQQSQAALIPTNQGPEQQIMALIQQLLGGG